MKSNKIIIGLISFSTIMVGISAVVVSMRLRQLSTTPVAPNVPQSQPRAVEVTVNNCFAGFDIEARGCFDSCNQTDDCGTLNGIVLTCLNNICVNPVCPSEPSCLCQPTPTPTPKPTNTPMPTPTINPSVTPTQTPLPTKTPTPTVTPKPSATPTPVMACVILNFSNMDPNYGDTLTLTCMGTPEQSVYRAEFEVSVNYSGYVALPNVTNTTSQLTVDQIGHYDVRCRVCRDASDTSCTAWQGAGGGN